MYVKYQYFSWKCVWIVLKICLQNMDISPENVSENFQYISPKNLSELFSKFVFEMSIFLMKMCLKNVHIQPQDLSELFLKFGCKMSIFILKMFLKNVNICPQNLSELFSKFVWIVFKICLRNVFLKVCLTFHQNVSGKFHFLLKKCLNCFQNLSAKCQYFSWNNWQKWFNNSNWDSGQICFFKTKWSTS